MVGAGKERIGLRRRVNQQCARGHFFERGIGKEPAHPDHTKGNCEQNQRRSHDRSAGKSSSGRNVSVEHHINTVNQCAGNQQTGNFSQDNVLFISLDHVLPGREQIFVFAGVVFIPHQKHGHAGNREKQYRGFTERIESPVVQNHAGYHVDRAGFLQAFFYIALYHFVDRRVVRASEQRQLQHGDHQHRNNRHTDQYRADAVNRAETV